MNNLPTVTKNLLIINVLCFFGMFVARKYGVDIENMLGLHFFLASDFNLGQLITYMFMHANFSHIFFNMFAVWMFGRVLEQVWGPKRFLTYYLICGIGAGLIQELVQYVEYLAVWSNYDSVNTGLGIIPMDVFLNQLTTVGASGAVYGILLAFGMLFSQQSDVCIPDTGAHQGEVFCDWICGAGAAFRIGKQRWSSPFRSPGRYVVRLDTDCLLEKEKWRRTDLLLI